MFLTIYPKYESRVAVGTRQVNTLSNGAKFTCAVSLPGVDARR